MSQMLYTKYRPKSLKDVKNQGDVIEVLIKSIEANSPASAYIFTGGRGTGKTSIARAFARDLSINEADIIEIDAASHTGINDIKELSENTHSLPFYSKYKMYIIDEVHMLSKSAANAFLKILEEPPAHVIFVLATTDPQKLPSTILSRCMQFTLKKPSLVQIEEYLLDVLEKENRIAEKIGIRNIAILGNGSYRDSLVGLQKVLSSESKTITELEINKILGIPKISYVLNFIKALDTKDENDIQVSLSELRSIESDDSSVSFFVENVLNISRLLLLLRFKSIAIGEIKKIEGDYISGELGQMLENKNPKLLSQSLAKLIEIQNTPNQNSTILSCELLLLS